jgi:hypothetical protein
VSLFRRARSADPAGLSWAGRAGFVILVLGIVLTLLDTLPGPFPMSLNVPAVLPDQRSIIVSVQAVSVLLQLAALGLLLRREPESRRAYPEKFGDFVQPVRTSTFNQMIARLDECFINP